MSNPRTDIVNAGARLDRRHLTHGTAGNISVRDNGRVLITPTGHALDALDPQDLAELDLDGRQVSGTKATKEWALHLRVMEQDATVGAVVHLHSAHAVALSCLSGLDPQKVLRFLTPYATSLLGRVRLVPYHRPGTEALADAVAEALSRRTAALMANHGLVVTAPRLAQALDRAEYFEEAARVELLVGDRPVSELTSDQVSELGEGLARS